MVLSTNTVLEYSSTRIVEYYVVESKNTSVRNSTPNFNGTVHKLQIGVATIEHIDIIMFFDPIQQVSDVVQVHTRVLRVNGSLSPCMHKRDLPQSFSHFGIFHYK
jgi:hypothetical protein